MLGTMSAHPVGEEQHDLIDRKIGDAGENAQDRDRDHNDDGGIAQLSLGRPRGFLKLVDHFAEEDTGAAERIFHYWNLAGAEGLEPPTDGFGDRYSTNWATRLWMVVL